MDLSETHQYGQTVHCLLTFCFIIWIDICKSAKRVFEFLIFLIDLATTSHRNSIYAIMVPISADEFTMLARQLLQGFCGSWKHLSFVLVFGLGAALAETSYAKRVALVIGNARYEHVSNIPNSANDANDIAAALERIGFEVTAKKNLDYREMRLTLRDFSEEMADAEMALVYFAGHGIEIDNTNYLIPTNAELRSDKDVEFEAIRLESVLNAVSTAKGLKLVIVDACRNNPFVTDMVRTTATRSIGQGLGRIDPSGVLVGYSARGGTLALDGDSRNSPYAEAFLEHIEVPGLELGKMFRKVRDTVYELTDGYQEPFTYGSLPGHDIFLVPAAVQTPSAPVELRLTAPKPDPEDEREQSAQRVLREAMGLDDEQVKLGALQMISRLYPNTRAGQYAHGVAEAMSSTSRNAATFVTPKTKVMSPRIESDQNQYSVQQRPAPNVEESLNLNRTDYRSIQRGLNVLGFSAGPVDGIFGTQSRAALRNFQSKNGVVRTGYLTAESVAVLKNVAKPEPPKQNGQQTRGQTLAAMPTPPPSITSQNTFYGDYVIELTRRVDPRYKGGELANERPKTVLRLVYRKSAAGFQLVSAQDFTKGGASRSKKYRASLSDKGKLRISGSTGYLFGKSRAVPFSITQRFSSGFVKGKSMYSNQGRFDDAFFVDVTITRR
ncbi:caspase family protein [Rhodobacteraceae bacterium B1Z28]|uniref:Caspase family protein n=1 Tax=Ruegeria haliotis TaxID=2747601 RepID=A0ABX2PU50_9RHOB|nr:caspase family protein [Ruegeria haliotis]